MLIFWTNRWSAQFPTITRFGALFQTKVFEAQTIVQLGCEFIQNMAKFQYCVCGFLFIFYHIPEDYSVDNYSIWCIRKIFYLHLSIPRAQANTVQHTYLIVVSITEIIEYYKNGYLLATVGTRLHLASGWSDDHSVA